MARDMEALRELTDEAYKALDAELTTAYYQFWKFGLRKNFYGNNVLPLKAETKWQHGLLQQALWRMYVLARERVNRDRHLVSDDKLPAREVAEARKWLRKSELSGLDEIMAEFNKVLKRKSGVEIDP